MEGPVDVGGGPAGPVVATDHVEGVGSGPTGHAEGVGGNPAGHPEGVGSSAAGRAEGAGSSPAGHAGGVGKGVVDGPSYRGVFSGLLI